MNFPFHWCKGKFIGAHKMEVIFRQSSSFKGLCGPVPKVQSPLVDNHRWREVGGCRCVEMWMKCRFATEVDEVKCE